MFSVTVMGGGKMVYWLFGRDAETVDHLFLHCSYASQVWQWMFRVLGVNIGPHVSLLVL